MKITGSIKNTVLLATVLSLLQITCGYGQPATPPLAEPSAAVELRGYGKVSAEFGKSGVRFHCQDAEHADLLLGKLKADLLWDGTDHFKTMDLEVAGQSIPAIDYPPYGVMVLGACGSDVFAYGSPDSKSMKTLLAPEPWLKGEGVRFKPAKPYPLYLDYYDLKAFKSYVHAAKSVYGEGLESHWAFIKKLGLGGESGLMLSSVYGQGYRLDTVQQG